MTDLPTPPAEETDGMLPAVPGYASSDTPETDAAKIYVGTSRQQYVDAAFAERLERERNKEVGYRGQWCDKARKAEAALDQMEDLTRELAATKKTLGTLIMWLAVELGEENVKRLLDMMSPQPPKNDE